MDHLQIVCSLLWHGVGVDIRGIWDSMPLRCASQSGHCDIVQFLLDHGADVNSQQDDHSTPLHWAAYLGDVDIVRVLLEHNADVNSKDDSGWTLHDAAESSGIRGDCAQLVRLLLEHGVNVNAHSTCNATMRRSSTMCTTSSGQGKNELGLGTQFDDERIDSVSYRLI